MKQIAFRDREWCEIKIVLRNGGLSITGSAGHLPGCGMRGCERYTACDGKAYHLDSCGQIVEDISKFFPEYADLLPWHLNDMQAGCEHQKANWNLFEKIEVVSYGITHDAMAQREHLQVVCGQYAAAGIVLPLTDTDKVLLRLDKWYEEIYQPPDADSPLSGCYEVKKRETKHAFCVYQKEHQRGLLMKPCEVCGYKYGSEWRKHELPAEILAKLASISVTDQGEE